MSEPPKLPAYLCDSCGHYWRTAEAVTTCPRCGNVDTSAADNPFAEGARRGA